MSICMAEMPVREKEILDKILNGFVLKRMKPIKVSLAIYFANTKVKF